MNEKGIDQFQRVRSDKEIDKQWFGPHHAIRKFDNVLKRVYILVGLSTLTNGKKL